MTAVRVLATWGLVSAFAFAAWLFVAVTGWMIDAWKERREAARVVRQAEAWTRVTR